MTVAPALDPALLPTAPPISVADVLDRQDGVYWVVKDANSVFLWINQNFASTKPSPSPARRAAW